MEIIIMEIFSTNGAKVDVILPTSKSTAVFNYFHGLN